MSLELSIIQAVQSLYDVGGRAADIFFIFLTFFGEETFVLLLLAAVYWCVDKKTGEFLILSLYISSSVNAFLKDIVKRPRPFMGENAQSIRYVKVENLLVDTSSLSNSYSFPSGHSQCAASAFGGLAIWLKKGWVTALGVTLTLGVMLSRIYLGVHYPGDVLAGAIIGLLFSFVSFWLFSRFYKNRSLLFAAAALVSLLSLMGDYTIDTLKIVSLGIGMAAGVFFEGKRLNFTVTSVFTHKVFRFVLGVFFASALKFGLKAVFPEAAFFDALRYMAVGFAVMYLWPLIFTKLRF